MAVDWGLVVGLAGVVVTPIADRFDNGRANPGRISLCARLFVLAAVLTITSLVWLTYEHPSDRSD